MQRREAVAFLDNHLSSPSSILDMTERTQPPKASKGKGKRWRKKIKFWRSDKRTRSVIDDSSNGISSATSGTQTVDRSAISKAASMPERTSPSAITLSRPTAEIVPELSQENIIDTRVTSMPNPQVFTYEESTSNLKHTMLEENSILHKSEGSLQSSQCSFPFLGTLANESAASTLQQLQCVNVAASLVSPDFPPSTLVAATGAVDSGSNKSNKSPLDPFDGVPIRTPEDEGKASIENITVETLSDKVQLMHEVEIEGQPTQNRSFTGVCLSLPSTASRKGGGGGDRPTESRQGSSNTSSSSLTHEEEPDEHETEVRKHFRQRMRMAAIQSELEDDRSETGLSHYRDSLATLNTDIEDDQSLTNRFLDKISCCCVPKTEQTQRHSLYDDGGSTLADGTLTDGESWTQNGTLADGTHTDESWTQNGTLLDETVTDESWTQNGSYATYDDRTMSTYELRDERYHEDYDLTADGESASLRDPMNGRRKNFFWGIFSKNGVSRQERELTDTDGESASLRHSVVDSRRKYGLWSMFSKKADHYYSSESEGDSHTDGSHIYLMMTDKRRQKSIMDKIVRENHMTPGHTHSSNSSEGEVLRKNKLFEDAPSAFDDLTDSSRLEEILPRQVPERTATNGRTAAESSYGKMDFQETERPADKQRLQTAAAQERWLQIIHAEILKQDYKNFGGGPSIDPPSHPVNQRREAAQDALLRMLQEANEQKQSMGP